MKITKDILNWKVLAAGIPVVILSYYNFYKQKNKKLAVTLYFTSIILICSNALYSMFISKPISISILCSLWAKKAKAAKYILNKLVFTHGIPAVSLLTTGTSPLRYNF